MFLLFPVHVSPGTHAKPNPTGAVPVTDIPAGDTVYFFSATTLLDETGEEFDIWMRLLSKVDNSVLWLLDPGETAKNSRARATPIME